jgi:transcriptional regulator
MYLPTAFATSDLATLDRLFERDAFVTLVSTVDGAPYASHLPVLYRRNDTAIELVGHWARPNPQWQAIVGQRVLAIVHGPHAYVSPTWYVDPDQRVPTWNYAVAHLSGTVALVRDADGLRDIVQGLARVYEGDAENAWRYDQAAGYAERILNGIVGFRLTVERCEIKLKLNQNHPTANVAGVIDGLAATGRHGDAELADWMKQYALPSE